MFDCISRKPHEPVECSVTSFQQAKWWPDGRSKEEFTRRHALFQRDDNGTYIKRLLMTAASQKQVMVEV